MALGDAIAYFRRRKKLQAKELAARLGITQSWLSQVERNHKHPSIRQIRDISILLKVDVSTILFEALNDETDRDLFNKSKLLIDDMINLLLTANYRK